MQNFYDNYCQGSQHMLLSTAVAMMKQKCNLLGDKSKFFLAKTCFRQQLKIVIMR